MRIIFCLFIVISSTLFAADAKVFKDSSETKTIVIKPKIYTPEQIITGDTLGQPGFRKDSLVLPGSGGQRFLPYQDSAYVNALRLRVPPGSRFQMDIRGFSGLWESERDAYENSLYQIVERNLDVPDEAYQPSGQEITAHQYNIERSLYVPYVNTYPRYGRFNMQSIGNALGVIEDVTPTMRYVVEYAMPVEVVIYSTQAVIVATIFKSTQAPGRYQITWNGKDDKGRALPTGDYIGEVRLGTDRTIRKRIEVPFPQEF